jgi:hypothetical protein
MIFGVGRGEGGGELLNIKCFIFSTNVHEKFGEM